MRRARWSETDPGTFTAQRPAGVIGSVQTTVSGHYIAFDAALSPIGRYDSLASARRSVARAARHAQRPLPLRVRRTAPDSRPPRTRAATVVTTILGKFDRLVPLPRITDALTRTP